MIYCVIVSLVINIFLIKKLCNYIFVALYVYIVDPALYLINLQLTRTHKAYIELLRLAIKYLNTNNVSAKISTTSPPKTDPGGNPSRDGQIRGFVTIKFYKKTAIDQTNNYV